MIHRLHIPGNKRKLLILLGDLLLMGIGMLALLALHAGLVHYEILHVVRPLKPWKFCPVPLWIVTFCYIFELYEVAVKEKLRTMLWVASVCFLSFCTMFALAKILKINQTTMVYLLIYHAILAVLLSGWRFMVRGVLLRTRHRIKSRVLFLGWDDVTPELIQSMRFHDFKIVGVLSLSENASVNPPPLENLGAVDQLQDVVDREMVDVIVTPIHADVPLEVLKKIYQCRYQGIRVYDSHYLYEILTGKVAVRSYLQRETTPYLNIEPFLHPFFRNVKRLMDCSGALLGLLATSPIFLAMILLQKVFSPGPVFFVQERVGFQEKPFSVIKFRTMIPDAEKNTGPVGALENDDRVTRLGKILRKYRLDELPQLLVILRGDMSFVGPRPIRRFFVNRIEEQMPFYSLRYSVKPGLTGWAQVHGRAGGSMEGHLEKFQYDLYYIKHASLFLDLLILLKTFQTLIRRPGF